MGKWGFSPRAKSAGVVATAIVAAACNRDPSPAPPGPSPREPAAEPAPRAPSPHVVLDEEVAISAGGAQMRGFSQPAAHPIQVIAEGKTHADKGFMVYVVDDDNLDHFKKDESFRHVAAFEGLKVRSFTHTDTLPAGSWTVVVKNSENLLNTMVVHVRVVSDPN